MHRKRKGKTGPGPQRRNTLRIVLSGIGAAVLISGTAVFFTVIAPRLRPVVVGLYGVDGTTEASIRERVSEYSEETRRKFTMLVLDPDRALSEQLSDKSGPDLVIGYNGIAFTSEAELFAEPAPAAAARMPTVMRNSPVAENRRYGLPLQIDHFETAVRADIFSRQELESLTFAELTARAEALARKGTWPFVCAGGNDEELLMLAGALTEATGGASAYRNLLKTLADNDSLQSALQVELGEDSTGKKVSLATVLGELLRWKKIGLIHPEWYRMKNRDVMSLMEKNAPPVVFMRLSFHRTVPLTAIQKYEVVPFPADNAQAGRILQTRMLVGAVPAGALKKKQGFEFLYRLISNSYQKILTWNTGLAPVGSTAEAQDAQASDVRLWIAASRAALPGIGIGTRYSQAGQASLAAEIRGYIESEGVGF